MLRKAEEILKESEHKFNNKSITKAALLAINTARKETIEECCNIAKTYKVGNSGSWYDAAVDKSIFINLINELK